MVAGAFVNKKLKRRCLYMLAWAAITAQVLPTLGSVYSQIALVRSLMMSFGL